MLCILSFFTVVGTASRRQHSDTATVLQGGLAHCAARLCGVRFLAPECGRNGLHRITLGVGLPLRPGEALCARLPAAQWVSTGAIPGGQCSNCTAILCPRRCAGSRRVQGDLAQPHRARWYPAGLSHQCTVHQCTNEDSLLVSLSGELNTLTYIREIGVVLLLYQLFVNKIIYMLFVCEWYYIIVCIHIYNAVN